MKEMPVKYVKGVGEKRALLLSKLGINSVYDLVHFYPRSYLDFSVLTPIVQIVPDTVCCFSAIVGYAPVKHIIRQKMTLYKTMVTDGVAGVNITIFNNSYLAEALEVGKEYIFYGKVTANRSSLEMTNPIIESADSECTMRPIYPQTANLNSRAIEKIIQNALKICSEENSEDIIPDKIRQMFKLCHEQFALKTIHSPQNSKDLEIARRRLIFEELLTLQLGMRRLKSRDRGKTELIIKKDYSDEFLCELPFEMTNAQKKALRECLSDMRSSTPMNRLIQGDVGSGKTAVAACLLYVAAKNGIQGAFMAPTEILALQHYESLKSLMNFADISVEVLTGSATAKKKREIKERLKNGEIDVLIGTHALLSQDVEFSHLGLVVTDEQHRFGVTQRGTLAFKGCQPHTLVMSATPIPRTLSLIIYGDLDLTVIDELPKGRQKISTYAVDTSYHERIYSFIKKHLDMGLQGYIVCPLVEESDMAELTSASEYAEELQKKEFRNYRVGLLHGKMKPKEKEKIMSAFVNNEIQLLVSTTVIEVGVDVPNSVIMVIENAERFGLSQLHQLRGRVGRGKNKSYCILISDAQGENAKSRLDIMCRTTDGFQIADKDLELRGPGDFFGSRQHGLPDLKIADITQNMDIVRESRAACEMILKDDPDLTSSENRALLEATQRLFAKDRNISLN
ncbi:MAG: ATP-dependent DNA helicase RecG [Clostridia bacterium]|nr:ATP-dependent DNA helicase RecG [Clostridia bacterium]